VVALNPDSIIHSDGWRGYNDLVDLGYKKHYRVNHGADQFVNRKSHINGIESFWAFAKGRLVKTHGKGKVPVLVRALINFCLGGKDSNKQKKR